VVRGQVRWRSVAALGAPALLMVVALAACFPAPTVAGVARFEFIGSLALVRYIGQGTVANRLTLASSGGDVVFTDTSGTVTPGTGCSAVTANSVRCVLSANVGIRVETGDGDDTLANSSELLFNGLLGEGDDDFTGGPAQEAVDGQAGDDELRGAGGLDLLSGDVGNDVLDGGVGNDQLFEGGRSALAADALDVDTFIGGPGSDFASYGRSQFSVRIDLDGVADDGRLGEGDDVRPDVESARGGDNGDVLVGNSGPNTLTGGKGGDIVLGGDGADVLVGEEGDDVMSGEAGDDELRGGEGTESLDGGIGSDLCDIGLDQLGFTTGCEIEVLSQVGTVAMAPRHLAADLGSSERLRVTWTHPETWRELDELEVRLQTRLGATVFQGTWDQGSDAVTQTLSAGVQLDAAASGAGGQNERKVRLELVVRFGTELAGERLAVAAAAVDDGGNVQDWTPVGTIVVATG
jgi:Ca2+-binding RTX toxin-like protein